MRRILCFLLPFMALLLVGCQGKEDDNSLKIYYLNIDATKIEAKDCPMEDMPTDPAECAEYMLELLASDPADSKHRRTIPEGVDIVKKYPMGYMYYLDFNDKYYDIPPTEEVLIRAAIVKTLTQIDAYSYVSFFVEGTQLTDSEGTNIGSMSADSFVENTGEQINTSLETEITLYFANKKGNKLVEQVSTIKHSTNKALEKVVVEKLMEGPDNPELISTIPQGTTLININVVDGICYVNFDDPFKYNQTDTVTEEVLLYSIVDSLCSLPNIDKVQIQINGNTDDMLKYNYSLATTYEENKDMVVNLEEPETQTEEIKGTETN